MKNTENTTNNTTITELNDMMLKFNDANDIINQVSEYCKSVLGIDVPNYRTCRYLKIISAMKRYGLDTNCIKYIINRIIQFANCNDNDIDIFDIDISDTDVDSTYLYFIASIDVQINRNRANIKLKLKYHFIKQDILFYESYIHTYNCEYSDTLDGLKEVIEEISQGD